MTILYVLTTSGNDVYIDLTYISLVSLLSTNPSAKVNVALDADSYEAIKKSKHPLNDLGLNFISVSTPEGKAVWKNRFVKCRMRKLVSGDFLYLDGDTIVRGGIKEIFDIPCSFAATFNHNLEFPSNFDEKEKAIFITNNWQLPKKNYYNAGVMFWRDNPSTQQLADLYIEKWEQSAKDGSHFDQPSLNSALIDWSEQICDMQQCFNAQFINDYRLSLDAVIWHRYYSGGSKYPLDYFQLLLDSFAKEGSLPKVLVDQVMKAKCALVAKNEKNEKDLIKLIIKKKGSVSKVDYYRHQTSLINRAVNKLLKK